MSSMVAMVTTTIEDAVIPLGLRILIVGAVVIGVNGTHGAMAMMTGLDGQTTGLKGEPTMGKAATGLEHRNVGSGAAT